MPDPKTPGQVAYEAFWHCHPNDGHWTMLDADVKQRWDAAAQAVLDVALAQRVWDRQAPSSRWRVVPPQEEDTP